VVVALEHFVVRGCAGASVAPCCSRFPAAAITAGSQRRETGLAIQHRDLAAPEQVLGIVVVRGPPIEHLDRDARRPRRSPAAGRCRRPTAHRSPGRHTARGAPSPTRPPARASTARPGATAPRTGPLRRMPSGTAGFRRPPHLVVAGGVALEADGLGPRAAPTATSACCRPCRPRSRLPRRPAPGAPSEHLRQERAGALAARLASTSSGTRAFDDHALVDERSWSAHAPPCEPISCVTTIIVMPSSPKCPHGLQAPRRPAPDPRRGGLVEQHQAAPARSCRRCSEGCPGSWTPR